MIEYNVHRCNINANFCDWNLTKYFRRKPTKMAWKYLPLYVLFSNVWDHFLAEFSPVCLFNWMYCIWNIDYVVMATSWKIKQTLTHALALVHEYLNLWHFMLHFLCALYRCNMFYKSYFCWMHNTKKDTYKLFCILIIFFRKK